MTERETEFFTQENSLSILLNLEEGQTPFPWQKRLLKNFLKNESVCAIDIPTGLGKTSVMAIWLAARSLGASLPRRLVYVVDRRAVVDQATEQAEKLRDIIAQHPQIAKAIGLTKKRLPISTLRGQHIDNREWLEDPSIPAIIVGTIDMVGSRLLFSGYGVSPKMRPYHAGFLGVDTLVVLDEAHLVPAFEDLLRTIEQEQKVFGPRDPELRQRIPPFRLLTLSATGRKSGDCMLSLSEEDWEHPVAKKRLCAPKILEIAFPGNPAEETRPESAITASEGEPSFAKEESDGEEKTGGAGKKGKDKYDMSEELARKAWEVTHQGTDPVRCLVFCDKREDAQKVAQALKKMGNLSKKSKKSKENSSDERTIDVELFVGGRRAMERTRARDRLAELGFLAGTHVTPPRTAFLVATSAGEVGVDLDADHMVCDVVAWERMIQRLGRVNRRGNGNARVIVVMDRKAPQEKENFWQAIKKLLDALQNAKEQGASPATLLKLRTNPELEDAIREATSPEPLHPALTRALIDAWSMTSLETHPGRPDVIEPWLRGFQNDEPTTIIAWRRYLPVMENGTVDVKKAQKFFDAACLHASELLEIETKLAESWLLDRASNMLDNSKAPQTLSENDVVVFVLGSRGDIKRYYTLGQLRTKDEIKNSLRGETLVVDARFGGLSNDGLLDKNENAKASTADDGNKRWLPHPDFPDVPITGFCIREIQKNDEEAVQPQEGWVTRYRFVRKEIEGEPLEEWAVEGPTGEAALEDERGQAKELQSLAEHQQNVAKWVGYFARRLGLQNDPYMQLLELAARHHDEGKQASRWQDAFSAPKKDRPYAKTKGPIHLDWLDGYRHELGSLPIVAAKTETFGQLTKEQQDFVLHLIAAHHGFARPLIGTSGCDDAPPSIIERRAVEAVLRFARLSRHFGPWGLAWWEAILRAADQMASRNPNVSP